MKYKMKSGKELKEVANRIVKKLNDKQIEKLDPPKPKKQKVKVFTASELEALIKDCLDVKGNGGYEKLAHKHKVRKHFIKRMERKVKREWEKRQEKKPAIVEG